MKLTTIVEGLLDKFLDAIQKRHEKGMDAVIASHAKRGDPEAQDYVRYIDSRKKKMKSIIDKCKEDPECWKIAQKNLNDPEWNRKYADQQRRGNEWARRQVQDLQSRGLTPNQWLAQRDQKRKEKEQARGKDKNKKK